MTSNDVFCPVCEGQSVRIVQRTAAASARVSFRDELSHCDDCGEGFYTYEQSMASSRARTAALRKAEGLPTPEAIRNIRTSLSLTQAAFEQALGVGKKTVVRWERGTVPPSSAACGMLWVAEHHPAVFLEYASERMIGLLQVEDPKVFARISAASGDESPPIVQLREPGGSWKKLNFKQGKSLTTTGEAQSKEELLV